MFEFKDDGFYGVREGEVCILGSEIKSISKWFRETPEMKTIVDFKDALSEHLDSPENELLGTAYTDVIFITAFSFIPVDILLLVTKAFKEPREGYYDELDAKKACVTGVTLLKNEMIENILAQFAPDYNILDDIVKH